MIVKKNKNYFYYQKIEFFNKFYLNNHKLYNTIIIT